MNALNERPLNGRAHAATALADPAQAHRYTEERGGALALTSAPQPATPRKPEEEARRLERELAAERAARLHAEEERDRLIAEFTAALSTRDDFLSAAAHDLKTPLAALQIQIQGSLRNAEREGINERFETRLKAMRRQARHLNDLVERLLDVPRIASGQLDLIVEDMDMAELVRDITERFAYDLEWARCPLALRASTPVVGQWDRTRIDQVLSNLLSNAMKYGRGAPIEISVDSDGAGLPPGLRADEPRYAPGPVARVTVRDHGIGIAPEQQARIFEKFQRAVSSQTASGLGLGLWIARHIVEACGGAITVESSPGAGSTFTVILPLYPPRR
jgi:signal transduction histidine kinase